jgi:hypothetical protein
LARNCCTQSALNDSLLSYAACYQRFKFWGILTPYAPGGGGGSPVVEGYKTVGDI